MHAVIAHDLNEKIRTKDVILEENVSFNSLLLPGNILKGLTECGFRKPSPIQFKAIPLGRCGFDLIIKSKSGTGKTLVFSTIALEAVNTTKKQLQIVILVPTREIAVQIQEVLRNIGRFIEGLNVESFIGGLPVEDDVKKAKQCHIAVGAPGRLKHLITMGALLTEYVRLFVLDEADKLMEASFQNDINEIYNTLPQRKQIIASSATYPQELDTFLSNYMLSPTHVSSENETPILLGLKQFVSVIKTNSPNVAQVMKAKNENLVEIFSKVSFTQCLVFSNYQTRAESISNYLNQKGWNSSFISAAQSQTKRLEAVNNLKEFKSRILLSTDLTARGIDAPNVDLVINYDVPQDAVTYLHRMGRAGRYGSSGICINLALDGDELRQLQAILGTIGATNISISVMPLLSENKNYDLWHLDQSSFEQIHGIVSPNNSDGVSQDIKNEILALKQVKGSNNKSKKKKKSEKKIKIEQMNNSNCVRDVLINKEEEVEEVCEKLAGVDADTLLQSLISGGGDVENNIDKRECKSENLLHLVSEVSRYDSEEDSKKRKRISGSECSKELQQEKRTNNSKQAIFYKNKALLSVTKVLFDPGLPIDEELVNSIDEYLTVLKEEEVEDFGNSTIEDILCGKVERSGEDRTADILTTFEEEIVEKTVEVAIKTDKESVVPSGSFEEEISENIVKIENTAALGRSIETVESAEVVIKSDKETVVPSGSFEEVLENIFKIGYQTAVGKDKKKWEDYLPQEELLAYQEVLKRELVLSSDSEEEEYEEEYEEEDYEMQEEENAEVPEENQEIALQWVPVVPTENSNEARDEYYTKCYEDCSNILWQNGLTFETVEDFDNWYYQWQEQLSSVRSYVQQNIYVEEMSKYQQSRFANT